MKRPVRLAPRQVRHWQEYGQALERAHRQEKTAGQLVIWMVTTHYSDQNFQHYTSHSFPYKKIAKSIRAGLLQRMPNDLGFLTKHDQTDGE